jgi:hypothetical protein
MAKAAIFRVLIRVLKRIPMLMLIPTEWSADLLSSRCAPNLIINRDNPLKLSSWTRLTVTRATHLSPTPSKVILLLHYVQEHLLDLGVCSVDGQKLQHIEGREDFGRIS